MKVASKGGARYFATFIDDYSRWCEVKFKKKESDLFPAMREYKTCAENFIGKKIKFVQSGNGREYVTNELDDYLVQHGIQRRLTVPHTPHQNGIAERKNRTLVETARCMMLQSKLLQASGRINWLPFKLWTGKHNCISLQDIRIGCIRT